MALLWHYHGTTMADSDTGSCKGCTWRPLDEHKRQNGQAGLLHIGLSIFAQVTRCSLQQHTKQSIISVTQTFAPFVHAAPTAIPGS
jgi:hypothetical protein